MQRGSDASNAVHTQLPLANLRQVGAPAPWLAHRHSAAYTAASHCGMPALPRPRPLEPSVYTWKSVWMQAERACRAIKH